MVIDGCNIGWLYANNDRFSADGIKEAYDCFKRKGYEDKDIHIVQRHVPDKYLTESDKATISFFEKIGILKFA